MRIERLHIDINDVVSMIITYKSNIIYETGFEMYEYDLDAAIYYIETYEKYRYLNWYEREFIVTSEVSCIFLSSVFKEGIEI